MEVVRYLLANGEISYSNTIGSGIPKIVLLAAASHLEAEVSRHIEEFFRDVTRHHAEALACRREGQSRDRPDRALCRAYAGSVQSCVAMNKNV